MRKITAFLLIALMAMAMLVPINAAPVTTDVLKGTPVVDGVLDDIYTQSASYEIDNFAFYNWGDCTGTDTVATAYFLWDKDFLYYAVQVTDNTILSAGADAGWQNDAVEAWFLDEELKFKIHAAADGNYFLGVEDGDGKTAFNFDNSKHAAVINGNKYVVEVALPMNNLKADKTFGFSLQINDIVVADFSSGSASGLQTAEFQYKCIDKEVAYPVAIVEDEVPAEVAPITETPTAPTTNAAQTADTSVVALVLLAIATVGAVICKKVRY